MREVPINVKYIHKFISLDFEKSFLGYWGLIPNYIMLNLVDFICLDPTQSWANATKNQELPPKVQNHLTI